MVSVAALRVLARLSHATAMAPSGRGSLRRCLRAGPDLPVHIAGFAERSVSLSPVFDHGPIATDKKIAHAMVGYSFYGGEDGNRTHLNGFAGRCITSLLPRLRN